MSPFLTDSEVIIISNNYKDYEFKLILNLNDCHVFRTALWKVTFYQYTVEICNAENGYVKYIGDIRELINSHILGR